MRLEHAQPDPSFASLTPASPGAPMLFCLPYAGGDVTAFWAWRQALDGILDVRAVMLPGRDGRVGRPGELSPEGIARSVAAELAGRPRVPYALYGHSMGARLAFEVARELRRLGAPAPVRLYCGAAHPPDRQESLARWTGLSDGDLAGELVERLGAPADLMARPDLRAVLIPALRTDLGWLRTYRHTREAPLPCPIIAFAAAHDREVRDPSMLGWARHTASWFRLHTLDAGHLFLNTHAEEVAATIAADLATAAETATARESPAPDGVHVWFADLGRTPGLCEATSELSGRERERAGRFRGEEHRRWFVGRSVLLRRMLRAYGVARVMTRPGGKPHTGTELTFSLSQSGAMVLVALAWGREVGADLEGFRRLADMRAFCEGALDERERAEFAALPEELRLHSALRTWTAKEAVLKATGDGLGVDPALFGFAGQQPGAPWTPETAAGMERLREWHVTHLPLARAVGAVATREPRFLLRFETVTEASFPILGERAGEGVA
ncbi:thioesterase domain-containing protein [Nonomuraea sp. NBC_01738]|uniref:thioesterase domain-containing protein n=1 Tax=Nonomuraea sp. NBC_01738 TaxID=2976003 RepID=UPI002E0E6352|nr:thioesterase domain-containing protein [Nonomuraea sp. NBC_01738]